ncbi:hypothetical protein HDV02_004902 [Globomyces sp. JEL0801]|nr:hypothetical protein HDV02_004902 [Globomyces sp. JEL0801]
MSWNGFVKAVSRATTTVMQQAGAVEKTIDKDYEEEEAKFRLLETRIENLHNQAKGYLDAVRQMTSAQKSIADTIDQFYDDNAPLSKAARSYKDAMIQMDENLRLDLVGVLPFVNEVIKKRKLKLLDYDRTRTTVKKLIDKPSEDPSKLAKAEADCTHARNQYEPLNQQLVTEIPQLIDMQIPYLNPSFEALVKSQLAFNEGAFHKLDAIKKSFPSNSDVGLEGRVEGVLQQMRELSICKS